MRSKILGWPTYNSHAALMPITSILTWRLEHDAFMAAFTTRNLGIKYRSKKLFLLIANVPKSIELNAAICGVPSWRIISAAVAQGPL